MKITFVYAGYENLGIEYLSAILKKNGHETSLIFDPMLFNDSFTDIKILHKLFSIKKQIITAIINEKPDLIAFSVVYNNYSWFKEIVCELKKQTDIPIVAGGHHITTVAENVLKDVPIDYGVIGEGESSLLALVESLEKGKIDESIPGLAYLKNNNVIINEKLQYLEDLDSLPFPDKSLYKNTPLTNKLVYPIMTSRGCPFSCSFCNNSFTNKYCNEDKRYRTRSVSNVIAELLYAKEKYSPKAINIYDELFALNISWLKEFTEEYSKKIKIPYMACTHPSIMNEERVKLLSESGCIKLDMGIQTINKNLRNTILNRKGNNSDIEKAISLSKKYGIHLAVENIINLPTETEEHLIEMFNFYIKNKPGTVKFYWLSYFPKTEIVNKALEHKIITNKQAEQINNGIVPTGSSFATGGFKSPRITRIFYLLFILMQFTPDKLIQKIVSKRLYRFFPASQAFTNISFIILRFFNRIKSTGKNDKMDVMIDRYTSQYKFYIKKILKMKFFRRPM
jgi:radical SAM superfamily enzyme YgiQ (UPF0313 family)